MRRLLLTICVLAFLIPQISVSQIIAIKAGLLIDPASGKSFNSRIILVEGERIKSVGFGTAVPPGARVIDLSAFTVLPGLIDAHTHLCTDVALDSSWQGRITERFTSYILQTSTSYRALTGVVKAASMLESGFTTVRDVGNAGNYADTDLRRAIENGLFPGPTIINAGRIIAPYGGQLQLNPERPGLGTPEYFYADTRDEMRKAIRENIHFGAKVIKVVVDNQPYSYSEDDLRFMVEEARRAGLKVAAHCHTPEAARNAVMAGVASIEHGTRMDDETLMLARKNGTALVGTEMPREVWELFGAEQRYAVLIDRLQRAHRIGVTLVYGSDALYETGNRTRGEMALTILDSWKDAGVPPLETLRAMTANAAKLLGVENERGAVAAGLAADLIAVPGNPLKDIFALKQVEFVMKNGKVIKTPQQESPAKHNKTPESKEK